MTDRSFKIFFLAVLLIIVAVLSIAAYIGYRALEEYTTIF